VNNSPSSAEQLNPYAAPSAELEPERSQAVQGTARFYGMSPAKAAVMSVLTMGIYDLCFWWRHWGTQRQQGHDVSVFWRTIFAPFCAFEYKTTLTVALVERNQRLHPMLGSSALAYMLAHVIENAVSRVATGHTGIVLVSSIVPVAVRAYILFVLQTSANQVLQADGYRGVLNRRVTAKTILAGLVGLLFWGLVLLGTLDST
jgi:hypothetical protein